MQSSVYGLPPEIPVAVDLEAIVTECEQRLGLIPAADHWGK